MDQTMIDCCEMIFSIKDNTDNGTPYLLHSSNTSYVQLRDSSKHKYLFFPTWFQQGMTWPPNDSKN